jgi:hypothetical protein
MALPPGVRLLPLWLGDLPPGLDPRIWHLTDGGLGGIAAMADAAQPGPLSTGYRHAAQPGAEIVR